MFITVSDDEFEDVSEFQLMLVSLINFADAEAIADARPFFLNICF